MMKKNGTQSKKSSKHQQQIRMDDDLKSRIRKYQERVEKSTGLEIGFSSVVRVLIEAGLKAEAARS
jgi:transposase